MAQNEGALENVSLRLRFWQYIWVLGVGAFALWVGLQTLRAMSDDAFIPLRCVRRALEGQGLTYNPDLTGEQPSTSPLNLLLTLSLAWVLKAFGFSSEGATLGSAQVGYGVWVVVSSLAGGYLVKGRDSGIGFLAGALASVLALQALSFYTAGLETPLFMALVLGGVGALSVGRLQWAFLLLALAVLARHDALLLYGLGVAWVVGRSAPPERQKKLLRAITPLLLVLGPWLVFSAFYYGTTIPTTLSAKMAQGRSIYWMESYSSGVGRWYGEVYGSMGWLFGVIGAGGACLFAWYALRRGSAKSERALPGVALLCFYSVLHFGVYAVLGVPPYHWYYLPYYAVGAVVAVMGLRLGCELVWKSSPALVGGWIVLVGLGAYGVLSRLPLEESRWGAYEEVGRYLADHPPRIAVGLMEIGIIGFYCPGVKVFDFGGIVTPEQRERLMRGQALEWMSEPGGPDKVVIRGERHPLEPDFSPHFQERFELEKAFAPTQAFPRGLQVWRVRESRVTGLK